MERLAKFNLSKWTKEDLIDLLEDYPNLFEMSHDELQKIVQDKYATARGYIDRANRLESDADAIAKYCAVKFVPNNEPLPMLSEDEFVEKYCHPCGTQRCEGIGTEWFEGCRYKNQLKQN